jgi:hypothetical protein
MEAMVSQGNYQYIKLAAMDGWHRMFFQCKLGVGLTIYHKRGLCYKFDEASKFHRFSGIIVVTITDMRICTWNAGLYSHIQYRHWRLIKKLCISGMHR